MTIKEIIRGTNVSTVFILPLFSSIAAECKYKLTSVPFNLLPLLYEYGLVKTFCYSYLSKDNNNLFLVFKRDQVTKKMINTTKPGQTLNNLLIADKNFKELFIEGDFCIYSLNIPKEFLEDVALIKRGQYSKTSKEYMKLLQIEKVVHKSFVKSELAHRIVQQNVAFAVCTKKPRIREELEDALQWNIPEKQEFYTKFYTSKEVLTPKELERLAGGE